MSAVAGHIQRYVLGGVLTAVAGALAVLGSVVVLIEFVDVSRTVGGRAEIGFTQILWLTVLKAPATILILLPFCFLFGTAAAHLGMNPAI